MPTSAELDEVKYFIAKTTFLISAFFAVFLQIAVMTSARADAVADSVESGQAIAYLNSMNATRSSNGLSTFEMSGTLNAHAQSHAETMGAKNSLFHQGDIGSLCSRAGTWDDCSENIGNVTLIDNSVSMLANMFLTSAPHRGNILNSQFDTVGIGVEHAGGMLWVSVTFMDSTNISRPTIPQTTLPKPAPPAAKSAPQAIQPAVATPVETVSNFPVRKFGEGPGNWYQKLPMITKKDFLGKQ